MAISVILRACKRSPVRVRLFLLLLMLLDASPVMGESSEAASLKWLTDMQQAVSGLNYKGVVAYVKDQQVESFQLFHSSKSGAEQERLVSTNSPRREVVRNAEKVSCYVPDKKKVFVEVKPQGSSLLVDLPADLAKLARYYRVEMQGQEYVASRLSQVIGIEPRDDYRYARLIWVDSESKLPLKVEMLDEDGLAVEQMIFTSVSIEDSIPNVDLEPSVQAENFVWQTNHRELLPLDSLQWTLQFVPDGFQIVSYTRLKRPAADQSIEHILLSDGFSSISIYIEAYQDGKSKEHPSKVGAINAHSEKVGDFFVTVMGEVPAKAVHLIARGLRHQDKRPP